VASAKHFASEQSGFYHQHHRTQSQQKRLFKLRRHLQDVLAIDMSFGYYYNYKLSDAAGLLEKENISLFKA
jgi:hypothetical protein